MYGPIFFCIALRPHRLISCATTPHHHTQIDQNTPRNRGTYPYISKQREPPAPVGFRNYELGYNI